MTITDVSTALDTAYTEQSIVAFTAGVLSNIAACVSEVEAKIQRGTLGAATTPTSTQVQNWLKRAKMEIAETRGYTWKRKYAYCSTVAGTYRYSLPPDYNGGYTSLRDTTNDRPIQLWDRHWYDTKFPDPSAEDNDEPQFACIKNMELWLIPPPNGAYTLEIEYDRSGAETTADDFNWLPEMERYRCCDFAISEAFEALHQWDAAKWHRDKWGQGLRKAQIADGKRRWRTMRFQAINYQQEYVARNNQPDYT